MVHGDLVPDDLRPDDPGLADRAHGWKSAYVHIPFCRRRCPYCDFAIVDHAPDADLERRYVDAVIAEIAMESDFGPLDAINFGGGTPSLVDPSSIATIVEALTDRFGVREPEVSIEVNPEDWTEGLAHGLRSAGVDRISIGAQSMHADVLGALGRLHATDQVRATVVDARTYGFRSIGLDLIIGHPIESDGAWIETVAAVLAMEVDHVSTYGLTVEPGTVLAARVRDGAPGPDDDVQAGRYEYFIDQASANGIHRYEVSNHARTGHHCTYNLSTWAHGEYVGFGMAAHGHRWGRRTRNHRRLDRYLESVEAGIPPILGVEELDTSARERDRLMLGFRLAAGTPRTPAADRFLASPEGQRFVDAGLVRIDGGRLIVTDPMRADMVARAALSVSGGDC
jgi:oxygen-independent coproporphyrinogen-3 oxidase